MPCNNSGFTDPQSTKGWGIVDFDCKWCKRLTLSALRQWSCVNKKVFLYFSIEVTTGSNAKALWATSKPMNDEELLFQQVKETTAASPETTVWVYRCSVYAYPWYTSVRTILDNPAYSPWFIKFKPVGPWDSPKCDNNYSPPLCRRVLTQWSS